MKKKTLLTLTTLSLTVAVAIGGTFAYLSAVTNTAENKFTSESHVTGKITEDAWDYDENGWSDYVPGDSTGKNPVIVIDEGSEDAYVGIKVTCKDTSGTEITLADFTKNYATISYLNAAGINSTDWERVDNEAGADFFTYKVPVIGGTQTNPLFDTVTINVGIVNVYTSQTANQTLVTYEVDENGNEIDGTRVESQGTALVTNTTKTFAKQADGTLVEVSTDVTTLPSFQIDVTGYAVQAKGMDVDSIYKSELLKLAGLAK